MYKRLTSLLLFSAVVLLFACQSEKDLASNFVDYYNREIGPQFLAGLSKSSYNPITRTYAELAPKAESAEAMVNITFVSNVSLADEENESLKNYLPSVFAGLITKDKKATELLDRGLKYKLVFLSNDAQKISEIIIDQEKVNTLTAQKSHLQMGTNNTNKNIKPEVKELLTLLNNGLPAVVDEELQIKLVKIDLNSLNDLVYTAEVDETKIDVENMKKEETQQLMKAEMLKDPQIKALYGQIGRLGLAQIRYHYLDSKGNRIAQILITGEDVYRK